MRPKDEITTYISTAESALAGIAALVPVGLAPELSHKRTEPPSQEPEYCSRK